MKGSIKSLLIMMIFTGASIFYVHLQVGSFLMSYDIHSVSREISKGYDDLRRVEFEVEHLKAPKRLEEKMELKELRLTLPEKVHLVVQDPITVHRSIASDVLVNPATGFFSGLMGSWMKSAQAESVQS